MSINEYTISLSLFFKLKLIEFRIKNGIQLKFMLLLKLKKYNVQP